jgi:hypothetical protein
MPSLFEEILAYPYFITTKYLAPDFSDRFFYAVSWELLLLGIGIYAQPGCK